LSNITIQHRAFVLFQYPLCGETSRRFYNNNFPINVEKVGRKDDMKTEYLIDLSLCIFKKCQIVKLSKIEDNTS